MILRREFLRRMAFAALACGFLDARLPTLRWRQIGTAWVDSERGDDIVADGSFENPFASLSAAMDAVEPMGTIFFSPPGIDLLRDF